MPDDPHRTERLLRHETQAAAGDGRLRPIGSTRHEAAVRRSLQWAEEAAALMDFSDALLWLDAITATGDQLSDVYLDKQRLWLLAAREATP